MSNQILQQFNGQNIRIIQAEGGPWFVLSDLCGALHLSNPAVVATRLDEDERCKLNLGPQGDGWVVNESGLYAVILRSDKVEAKAFRKWVTYEVLPSIRQTGSYSAELAVPTPALPTSPLTLARQMLESLEAQEVRVLKIEHRLDTAPITSEKVGTIFKLGQQLGQVMGDYRRAWRLFKDRFGLASYRDLPTNRYEEGVHFLRLQIKAHTGQPMLGDDEV